MMMLDHHIEYSQQLPNTGCERHFLGLAGPTKTLEKSRITELYRMATNAAMYRAARTCPRSPHALRFPRVPLPRLKGAAPTKAAISPRVRALGSGSPEGHGQDRSHSRIALGQLVSVSPHERGAYEVSQIRVRILLQPADVLLSFRRPGVLEVPRL